MPVLITETAITNAAKVAATRGRVELSDKVCPGLRLRIGVGGQKTWVLACRDQAGRMRRFQLGKHPAMGLAAARTAARALHAEVKLRGADPTAQRRLGRVRTKTGNIFSLAELFDVYGAKRGNQQKSWPEARKRITAVFAGQMKQPLKELSREELQVAADSYKAVMTASAAVRYLRPVLKWGSQRGYLPDTLALLHPPATIQRRKRVLTEEELVRILPVLQATERPAWQVMHFLLLTLARREEAASARWCDVDLCNGTWSIPSTKNGEQHVVPLSKQAIEHLKKRAGSGTDSAALVFSTPSGKRISNWDREGKLLHVATGTENWHRHDLRRTAATILGNLGEMPDIIEAALNHQNIRSPLAATYNRSRYLPQVRQALQTLADYLDGISAGDLGKIIAFKQTEKVAGAN